MQDYKVFMKVIYLQINMKNKYKQIGNSVFVPVVERIAKNIIKEKWPIKIWSFFTYGFSPLNLLYNLLYMVLCISIEHLSIIFGFAIFMTRPLLS